ncbi:MAG: IclR family transcriptional regulator [Pseudomonadota bacterium]
MNQNHRVPAIDRTIEMLGLLERHEDGLSIQEFVAASGVPRSSVYRILNSLESHAVVQREARGRYVLGSRLLGLAARVRQGPRNEDLAALARPFLRQISARTHEASKISVLHAGGALCIEAMPGTSAYALAPLVGRSYPLHAGAASKVLFAAMDPRGRSAVLERGLRAYTQRTLTDPAKVEAELRRVRRNGWAEDRGEFSMSVRALGAPVHDASGGVVAAISIAYLAELHGELGSDFRRAVIETADAVTAELEG